LELLIVLICNGQKRALNLRQQGLAAGVTAKHKTPA